VLVVGDLDGDHSSVVSGSRDSTAETVAVAAARFEEPAEEGDVLIDGRPELIDVACDGQRAPGAARVPGTFSGRSSVIASAPSRVCVQAARCLSSANISRLAGLPR
jgi:hypothetical protein